MGKWLWLFVVIVLTGCPAAAAKRGELAGFVLFNGQPVGEARVLLEDPQQGTGAMVELDATGRFVARDSEGSGLPIGTYRLAVKPKVKLPPAAANGDLPLEALAGSKLPLDVVPQNERIPERFYSFETSGLSVEIKAGKNPELVVDLAQ